MQTFAELRSSMQALFDQTAEMSSSFDSRVAAATAEVVESQAKMIVAFSARDRQLQEHIDTAQRNNILSLELHKGLLSVFTEQKQSELLATVEGRLQATCQKLYDPRRCARQLRRVTLLRRRGRASFCHRGRTPTASALRRQG